VKCIGTGGFSKVFLCRFKETGVFYAMKVIDKEFIIKNKKKKIVMNERNIMVELKHPFLIEMKFAFESKESLIFVLELCPGGELFSLVKKFRMMNEEVAKFYMIEILLGLEEIHKNHIIYRDFKP
jgi:serine/threonine protein kinase